MYIKLPTLVRTPIYQDGELVDIKTEKKYIDFSLDFSIYAEERYERYIRDRVPGHPTFMEFISKVANLNPKNLQEVAVNFRLILKVLYCFLESKEVPTFEDFLKLFDFEIAQEILDKTVKVIELSQRSVGKN